MFALWGIGDAVVSTVRRMREKPATTSARPAMDVQCLWHGRLHKRE